MIDVVTGTLKELWAKEPMMVVLLAVLVAVLLGVAWTLLRGPRPPGDGHHWD